MSNMLKYLTLDKKMEVVLFSSTAIAVRNYFFFIYHRPIPTNHWSSFMAMTKE